MTNSLIWNASGFDLLFLTSALVGVWFSRLNLREAWGDFRALGGISNGRRYIAITTIVVETLLLSIHSLYIIAGLVAVSQPGSPVTAIGVLILCILVYASWAITAISVLSRRLRHYLSRYGMAVRDGKGRFTKVETQDQREDRQFGEARRDLEQQHIEDAE